MTGVPCPNCGSSQVDRFCAGCGQKRVRGRLDARELLEETFRAVVDVDHGVFRLTWDLARRPGATYRDYLEGKRKRYVNPVFYLLLIEGVFILLDGFLLKHRIALRTAELWRTLPDVAQSSDRLLSQLRAEETVLGVDKFKYLIGIPFVSITTWPLFRRRYTLAEVTVFWILVFAFASVVDLAGFPFRWLLIEHIERVKWLFGWAAGLVMLWHIFAFFGERKALTIVKCVLTALWVQVAMNLAFRLLWQLQHINVNWSLERVLRDSFGL